MASLGIDFGTTNSVAASFVGGSTVVHPIGEPPAEWVQLGFDRVLPSIVALDTDRRMVFGWEAKALYTEAKFEAIKRLFREEESVTQGDETFYVEEIAAALFTHIGRRVVENGVQFDNAVVTIPANSRGLARHRTKVCAQMGGINVLSLLNEPTAAAMAYARRHDLDGQTVLVYDFGGGTLDVTVLAVNDGMFFEQGSTGIARLGGIDFDREILRHLADENPSSESWSTADKQRLLVEIEKAKIRLSTAATGETVISDPTLGNFRLTRPTFETLTTQLVERSGNAIRRTLSDLRMAPSDVDKVLLVGGTSKVPAVSNFVSEILGQEPATGIDPMTAIGEGAAIAAAILNGEIEDTDYFLSTEHAMGTVVADPVRQELRFATVIPKNQKLPASRTEAFVPMADYQESVMFTVMEGDPERPLADPENLVLMSFDVPLDPKPADEVVIGLTYAYDVDGMLHVDVSDAKTGEPLVDTISLSTTGGLGGRELVEMAGRVAATAGGGAAVSHASVPSKTLDPESDALISKARSKVLPFIDDDDAEGIRALIAEIEQSDTDDRGPKRSALENALQRFSYLF